MEPEIARVTREKTESIIARSGGSAGSADDYSTGSEYAIMQLLALIAYLLSQLLSEAKRR